MTHKTLIFLLACFLTLLAGPSFAHSSEFWLSMNMKIWDNAEAGNPADTKLYLYSEVRQRDEEREIYGAFNGVVLRHEINPFLQIGAGIKHITFRSGRGGFDPRFRTELEVTSSTLVGEHDQFKLSVRNRWELFKNRGKKDINRLRHRVQIQGELDAGYGLRGWFMSHELIYTQERGEYNFQQYRLIPIGLKFHSPGQYQADVFYMLSRHSGPAPGGYVHVLGLNVTF